MISSVSSVHFGNNAQSLINDPGKFSQLPAAKVDAPADEFVPKNKKSSKGGLATLAIVALAAFAGLGVAVKKGKLAKVENAEKFMDKIKNIGASIGGAAEKCWNKITGLFSKKADKVAEAAEKAAETVA